jgi:subtilase family serine protease
VRLNLFILFVFAALSILSVQGNDVFGPIPKPLIEWKYGWQDGMKANTVGSAKNGDPVPKGTSYVTSGYSPDQIANAYGVNFIATNGNGTNQSIAIVVAYGNTNIQHDLDVFCTKFGIPSTTIQTYYPNGYPTESPVNNANWSGWASETSLDVEWVHAMAPAAKIMLVVDTDGTMTDQCVDYAVTNLNAKVVSMSYGTSPEYSSELDEDSFFQSPGVVYLAAIGDSSGEIDYPAASPYVIAVGGTELLLNNGVYTESAWNMTGGGPSIYEPFPAYQAGVNTNTNGIDTNTMGRGTPDVSAVADVYTGISVYFTDPTKARSAGWIISGGTSASTPIWAGIMARRASLGFSNDHFLTLLYSKQANSWPCKDITNGQSAYTAVKGYDLATGLGSPRADQIVMLDSNSSYHGLSQIITFPPIPTKTFKKSPPFKLAATASSKLTITYSILSGPATNSGVLGNTVAILGGGTVVLAANQLGNLTYAPAAEVTNSFIVNPSTQSITFPALGSKPYSTNPITLDARASSLLPIVYTITNGPASLVGSNSVVIAGIGSVIVSAMQSGNSDYLPATKLMNFNVIRASQKISPFSPIPNQIGTNSAFPIALPTANSGLHVKVAIKSGPATLVGNMISLTGALGTVVLTANQIGDPNHLPAPQVTTSFKVTAP